MHNWEAELKNWVGKHFLVKHTFFKYSWFVKRFKCSFTCCILLEEFHNRHLGLNEESDAVEKQEYTERGRGTTVSVKIGGKIPQMKHFEERILLPFSSAKLQWEKRLQDLQSVDFSVGNASIYHLQPNLGELYGFLFFFLVTPRKIICFGNLKSTKYLLNEERILDRSVCVTFCLTLG